MPLRPPDLRVRLEELVHNPINCAPIALGLDCSGSMAGDPIAELNAGVRAFVRQVSAHKIAKASAELCVVTFADQPLLMADFQSLEPLSGMAPLVAAGLTDLGGGVSLALDRLTAPTAEYQWAAVQFYKPCLVVMTDGVPTTDRHPEAAAVSRVGKEGGS
jgi:uncharacterized protein YegL